MSETVKPGYKQTEVGVIPEEWEALPFGKLAHLERGKFTARPRNDPRYDGGDISFIQTGDVTNANGPITTYSQTLNAERGRSQGQQAVSKRDSILHHRGKHWRCRVCHV